MLPRSSLKTVGLGLCMTLISPVNASMPGVRNVTFDRSIAEHYHRLATEGKPIVIEPDFASEQVHLFLNGVLSDIEETVSAPALNAILTSLETRPPGRSRARDFVLVGRLLLTGGEAPNQSALAREVALVLEAKTISQSPVMGYKEDYSQYRPRGLYTRSEALKRYFRARMWLARMGFYVEPETELQVSEELAAELFRDAQSLASALQANQGTATALLNLEAIRDALTGPSDETAVVDLIGRPILREDQPITSDLLRALKTPRIASSFVGEGRAHPPRAIRFFGQSLLVDAVVLHGLTFDRVAAFVGTGKPFTLTKTQGGQIRGVPTALDILNVLGSAEAKDLLKESQNDRYKGYGEQVALLQAEVRVAIENPSSFADFILAGAARLIASKPPQGESWDRSAAAVWALMRHDFVLAAKQSYTSLPKGLGPTLPKVAVTVRGPVDFYTTLRAAVDRLADRLSKIGTGPAVDVVIRAKAVSDLLRILGEGASSGTALNAENASMVLSAIKKASHENTAVVVDVHTDPASKQVLEVGVAPSSGRYWIYEARVPVDRRMTDEDFVKGLLQGQTYSVTIWPPASTDWLFSARDDAQHDPNAGQGDILNDFSAGTPSKTEQQSILDLLNCK